MIKREVGKEVGERWVVRKGLCGWCDREGGGWVMRSGGKVM